MTLEVTLTFGQIMRYLTQPAVLGELLGGVVLGATIFGSLFREAYNRLFQPSENVIIVREIFIRTGMLFFMFSAGLRVNLLGSKYGKKVLMIGFIGTLLSITCGIGLVYLIPQGKNRNNYYVCFSSR